jgi:uncharacterized membrane protein required for colicin V production
MLTALVLILMGVGFYAGFREGVFTSFCMLVNAFLAGLVAFNFFEPIAAWLESVFRGSPLLGYEDFLALATLFVVTFMLLRLVTNNLSNRLIDLPARPQQFGGGGVGLLAGYWIGGFFLCSLQTLPWHESFLDFEPRTESESGLRAVWPPDRAWLSLMRFAGANCLAWSEIAADAATRYDRFETFDRAGTFELRYQRYRRYNDSRGPMRYEGELDDLLSGKK